MRVQTFTLVEWQHSEKWKGANTTIKQVGASSFFIFISPTNDCCCASREECTSKWYMVQLDTTAIANTNAASMYLLYATHKTYSSKTTIGRQSLAQNSPPCPPPAARSSPSPPPRTSAEPPPAPASPGSCRPRSRQSPWGETPPPPPTTSTPPPRYRGCFHPVPSPRPASPPPLRGGRYPLHPCCQRRKGFLLSMTTMFLLLLLLLLPALELARAARTSGLGVGERRRGWDRPLSSSASGGDREGCCLQESR